MRIPEPPPPPPSQCDPKAVITRQGRWIYSIDIIEGFTGMNRPWIAFSRAHAERRARRKLAWYLRKYGPPREQWTIHAP
jgi:hypothetical protein